MICLRRVFVTEQKPYKEQRMYKNQSSLIYVFLFLFLGVGVGGGTLICPMYCLVAPNLLTYRHGQETIKWRPDLILYGFFFCSVVYFIWKQTNRFLHTFLGKTGWSSTSDRNFMSFREWSTAKRAKRNKNFYHEWKITQAFPTTHISTYFFRKPTTFTIANS
jgi:hypothetical protein